MPGPRSTGASILPDRPDIASSHRPGSFARDVLRLVSGTVFAQSVLLLASPLLTRLYGPEAFGISALFSSVTGLIATVLCLRYELSIVLPESDGAGANLFAGSLAVSFLVSLLTIPLVWFGGIQLCHAVNAPQLSPFLWLIPPVTLFGGVALGHPALNYWASRMRRFEWLSLTRVVNSVVTTSGQLAWGFACHGTPDGLIGGGIAGSVLSTLLLAFQTLRAHGQFLRRSVHWHEMLAQMRSQSRFPLYGMPSALLNAISWQLPPFLLSGLFSPTVAGFYALGSRVVTLPGNLVGSSIGQVFFQRAAEAKSQGRLAEVVESTFRILVALGMLPFLLLTLTGRDLFVVVFGQRWAEAGVYVQILGIWSFVWFISSPLSPLLSVLERQDFDLAWNAVNIATRSLSLWVGSRLHDGRLAMLLFAVSGVLVYSYLLGAIMTASGVGWRKTLAILFSNLALFTPAALLLLFLEALRVHSWLILAVSGALFTAYLYHAVRTIPQLRAFVWRACRSRSIRHQ